MCITQLRIWYHRFKNGQEETSDNLKSGRPRTRCTRGNTQSILDLVQEDSRRSIRGLANTSGLTRGTVWNIVKKDLRMRRRCARLVPHLLTPEQKAFRKRLCEENLRDMRKDPAEFLSRIVTCDETWIATYEPETKLQSSAWVLPEEGPPPKKSTPIEITKEDDDDCFFFTSKGQFTLSTSSQGTPSGQRSTVRLCPG